MLALSQVGSNTLFLANQRTGKILDRTIELFILNNQR